METTLCLDFGNTRLKYAVFENNKLTELLVLPNDSDDEIRKLIEKYHPDKSILSSVIHHNPGLEKILGDHSRFHLLNFRSKLPFSSPVGKPETIGADRLALAAAAVHFYPGQHNLIMGLAFRRRHRSALMQPAARTAAPRWRGRCGTTRTYCTTTRTVLACERGKCPLVDLRLRRRSRVDHGRHVRVLDGNPHHERRWPDDHNDGQWMEQHPHVRPAR